MSRPEYDALVAERYAPRPSPPIFDTDDAIADRCRKLREAIDGYVTTEIVVTPSGHYRRPRTP